MIFLKSFKPVFNILFSLLVCGRILDLIVLVAYWFTLQPCIYSMLLLTKRLEPEFLFLSCLEFSFLLTYFQKTFSLITVGAKRHGAAIHNHNLEHIPLYFCMIESILSNLKLDRRLDLLLSAIVAENFYFGS